jgi:hypothetical protein
LKVWEFSRRREDRGTLAALSEGTVRAPVGCQFDRVRRNGRTVDAGGPVVATLQGQASATVCRVTVNCDANQVAGHAFDTPSTRLAWMLANHAVEHERFRDAIGTLSAAAATAGTLSRRLRARVGRMTHPVTLPVTVSVDADQVSGLLRRRLGHQLGRGNLERRSELAHRVQTGAAVGLEALDGAQVDTDCLGELALKHDAFDAPVLQRWNGSSRGPWRHWPAGQITGRCRFRGVDSHLPLSLHALRTIFIRRPYDIIPE